MATNYEELLAQHNYAIIDRALLEDESEIDGLPVEPLVPHEMRGDVGILPMLLPLEAEAPYIKTLIETFEAADFGLGRYPFTCLLTAPGVTPSRMKAHLTARLVLHSPRGGKDLLRYYDPRVFPHLVRILTPEQLRALYGPIQAWTFIFQQAWQSLSVPEVAGIVPGFWVVDDEQHAQLNRVIQLNTVLSTRQDKPDRAWVSLAEYSDAAQTADAALKTAQTHYRLSEADSAVFALHALEYGEQFHRHPRIQPLLRAARQNKDMPYAATASKLDARSWAQVAAESI
jgi:hypothetical protein